MKSVKKVFAAANAAYFVVLAAVAACYIVMGGVELKAAASAVFVIGTALNLCLATVYKLKGYKNGKYFLLSAAILCFAGDVALCYNFIAGMALFAMGHIAFTAAFCCINCVGWRTILPAAALIAFSVSVIALYPAYDFGSLLPAVIVYAVIICCMFGRAFGIALDGRLNVKIRISAIVAAAFFFVSDFLLTIETFAGGGRIYGTLCLVFYYSAQYVFSLLAMFASQSGDSRVKPQMNVFYRLICRAYQAMFRLALPLMPYRQPKPLGGSSEAAALLKDKGKKRALIVTDKNIYAAGLCKPVQEALARLGIDSCVYSETVANPTVSNVEAAAAMFIEKECDCLIAVGGGSAMDCAKAAGALIIKPKKSIYKMRGVLKVFGRLPLFIAVPTTAGTGSETTIAAVITDDKTRDKFTIISFCLAPHYAILDPLMTKGLPPAVTATTGMDALTHAVEAYIGRSTTRLTRRLAVEAVSAIRANLYEAYKNGANEQARMRMQQAAYYAGLAFTISYVGYVHAVAHSLGGKYNTPHGLANSVILPYVLKRYGISCRKKLARLARESGVADVTANDERAANEFIAFIEDMNEKMGIPKKLKVEQGDITELARHAAKEANPLYPVPELMCRRALENIYKDISE